MEASARSANSGKFSASKKEAAAPPIGRGQQLIAHASTADAAILSIGLAMTFDPQLTPFGLDDLRGVYDAGAASPVDVIEAAFGRIAAADRGDVWISLIPREQALAAARRLAEAGRDGRPLYGVPFAVKDNIDVAGLPTTAACPDYAYVPERSAACVERLTAAGAICIGKTNLDQFATGLSGVRSPYGACGSAFERRMIAGGSSSGSAVAVALHQVAFALGTDTGGSGRVPSAFNNVVGLKPTIGVISTRGLVPNCRTIDCVSVFGRTVADCVGVAEVMRGFDADNPFSRRAPAAHAFACADRPAHFRIGVPSPQDLTFFGDDEARALYLRALAQLQTLGGTITELDFKPFVEAGRMLFDGPWVAERLAAFGSFLSSHPDSVLPVTRGIVEAARKWSAADTFAQLYRLHEIKAHAATVFATIDALVVPTVARRYTIAELEADPIARNTQLGYYSYYANLLDLCAVAVPSGFYQDGFPCGVTLLAPAFHDSAVAALARALEQDLALPKGRPPAAGK
jgi:allophanate hydrolase